MKTTGAFRPCSLAYAKNERDDLSETQKRTLKRVIETEYP